MTSGFGTTTNIINGGVECGPKSNSEGQLLRAEFYLEFLRYLGGF